MEQRGQRNRGGRTDSVERNKETEAELCKRKVLSSNPSPTTHKKEKEDGEGEEREKKRGEEEERQGHRASVSQA
jgi:hypothetical protein